MKPLVPSLAMLHVSLLVASIPGHAADPLPAPEMDSVFIAPPTAGSCKDDRKGSQSDCPANPDHLKDITDYSIRESTTLESSPASPQLPPPQLPPEQDVTPQQLQLIEDFTQRPWGR